MNSSTPFTYAVENCFPKIQLLSICFHKKLKLTLLCRLFHKQIELIRKFKTKLNQTLQSAPTGAAFLRSTLLCRRYASQALLSPRQASQALLSPGAALPRCYSALATFGADATQVLNT